jgi:hypothetical protein
LDDIISGQRPNHDKSELGYNHIENGSSSKMIDQESQQNNNSHRQKPHKRTWIRKKNQYRNEECTLALQYKHKKCGWYVDSGFSKNMIGDEDKFLTLRKERYGSISIGSDDSTRIIGKGTFRIGNKGTEAENVLLVEDMKHNIISVCKMCDQGHNVILDSQKCKIRKAG